MTPKSAQLRRPRHPAGIVPRLALPAVSGQRATLAVIGAGHPDPYRTAGALALAPVFPLALAGPPALVFASLGIAPALHGRRALRARTLNLAAVAASVAMNALAAEPGWRNLAIWALPPVAYALASDTLITVLRTRALTPAWASRPASPARHRPHRRGPGPEADLHPGAARTALRKAVLAAQTGDPG